MADDYSTKISLKCKKIAGPALVTLETERGSDGALSSKVGTRFNGGGVSFDKIQIKADGGHVLETSFKPHKDVSLSFKGNKGADVGIDYVKGNFVGTSSLDVKDLSKFSTSACVGVNSNLTLGGEASYNMAGNTLNLSVYNVGASYRSGPLFASVTSATKVNQFNVGLLYKVNSNLALASVSSHSTTKPVACFTVGGAYNAKFGMIKAKMANDGLLSACLIKEVAPNVLATATGSIASFDTSTLKYGLGISL